MDYCAICDKPIPRGHVELWNGKPWCGVCEPIEQDIEPEVYPQTSTRPYLFTQVNIT